MTALKMYDHTHATERWILEYILPSRSKRIHPKTQINVNVKEMHSRGECLISYLYKIGGGEGVNKLDILSVAFNECDAKDVIVLFSKKLQHNTVKIIFIYTVLF